MSDKYSANAFRRVDLDYRRRQGWITRIFTTIFRRKLNEFSKSVISSAFERSAITSVQFHELAAIIDRRLFPEYTEPKRGGNNVTQSNITCGGDCAGGDINK